MAAELKIADRLAVRPCTVAELATATGAHQQALRRLLRLLAGAGVFREEPDGQIALPRSGSAATGSGICTVASWAKAAWIGEDAGAGMALFGGQGGHRYALEWQ